ncbi:MAG: hypothetical protein PHU46_01715 [Rhodocyclaceae bacterium]|nr:hypothetical protein [Rhodocyclaceae bacterium]
MGHRWKFFRAGGFDQVRIETAEDLLNLGQLDPKLWVALACPTKGVEFDARTLALLDTDGDGYIRAPELLSGITWAAERLNDISVLAESLEGVPLGAIREDGPGAALRAAASGLTAEGMITVASASTAEGEQAARAEAAWNEAGLSAQPLGAGTEAADAALCAVRAKVDDWFMRCRLAAFDARAAGALNASEDSFKSLAASTLNADSETIAALPLATVAPGAALPLGNGINPAWAARIAALGTAVVAPLLGDRQSLTEADWQAVQEKLAPYAAWRSAKPAGQPPEAEAIRDLERLARYVRDLMPLANNFVAFRDFYTRSGKAMFQIGTLYLDGRSADLCVAVTDAAKHAALASLSRICLVYCDCTRAGEKLSIAAAFTAGDSDQLMAGRNGVFYDRAGRDWNATITRIVDHPISLRQAFWSPYKRLMRLVGEQLQKIAGNKAKDIEDRMAAGAANAGKKLEAPGKAATPAQQAFDVGKFAGIFAAIGLAVGAIGTALASVVTGLLGLKLWQLPLVVAGVLLLVSGPAVVLAWFKLRSRNLGPILDANGWAVNARARINIPFGTALTQLARLPEGAERSLTDPYAEKSRPWGFYAVIALALLGAAAWYWR